MCDEDARRYRMLSATLEALRETSSGIDSRLSRLEERLEDVRTGVSQLRAAAERRAETLDARISEIERRGGELIGRTDLLRDAMEKLASEVDRQATQGERALEALQEASERQLTELRETHILHVRALEDARHEAQALACRSRERLGRRLVDIAEFLEGEVPPPSAIGGPTPAAGDGSVRGWRRPLRKAAARLRRHLRQRRELARLEERVVDLQSFLVRQRDERVRRGRALREAWLEESALFAAAGVSAGRPAPDDERPARELSARRTSFPARNGNGFAAAAGASRADGDR